MQSAHTTRLRLKTRLEVFSKSGGVLEHSTGLGTPSWVVCVESTEYSFQHEITEIKKAPKTPPVRAGLCTLFLNFSKITVLVAAVFFSSHQETETQNKVREVQQVWRLVRWST